MAVIDKKTYALGKKYTDNEVAGGGAIKGKNCVIDSIAAITGGHRVTFKWTLDNGTVQTGYMDVMDGTNGAKGDDGLGIKSVDIDANNHLIITYDDDTTWDAGEIQIQGQTIQRNVLPTASVDELGNIYQYIGADTATLTNGYFYQCVADGAGYKWEEKKVQSGGGSGVDNFKDLDDVRFSNLKTGDIPVYNETTQKWENNGQIPLDITALQGSMGQVKLDVNQLYASEADLKVAIQNLDALMASKVDKEAGKGLSTNDFTNEEKQKLGNLAEIYTVGSGLLLDGSVLKATGIEVPMDAELDETSTNPVQNKGIAVPVHALQGSMANVKLEMIQLSGSMADLKLDMQQLEASMAGIPLRVDQLDASMGQVKLDVQQLQASMANAVVDPNYVHTDNNYSDTEKAIVSSLPLTLQQLSGSISQVKLDEQQLEGSVVALKLNVNQLSGSMSQIKLDVAQLQASMADLHDWHGPSLTDASHKVVFDNLDDTQAYKLFGKDRLVRIENVHKDPGTTTGTVKATYTTDAPQNTECWLLQIKK